MKKVILQHKFWLVAVIFATAGLTTVELLKAFLMQYILDSATIGTMERLQTACFLTLGFLILMVLLGLLYDTVTGYFVRICMETVTFLFYLDSSVLIGCRIISQLNY